MNYTELFKNQQQAFQNKLKKEVSQKKSAHNLNWELGVLSVVSLLLLAYLLMKPQLKLNSKKGKKMVGS